MKIAQEEKMLKQILQQRVEHLQQEKTDINLSKEVEGEYKINKLNTIMNKLVKEKHKLEEYYSFEVKEKQELVLALAKEKKNLTNEMQALLKEIKKSKHKIKKHVGTDHLKMHSHQQVTTWSQGTPRTLAQEMLRTSNSNKGVLLDS